MRTGSGSRLGLYPRLLGTSWCELDPAVRDAHADAAVARAVGSFRIRHGTGRLGRLLLRAARVPPPADAADVQLLVRRRGSVEWWHRRFGGAPLVTVQREGANGLLIERLGPVELRFRLVAVGGTLVYRQVGLAVRVGPFGLRLPRWISPQVTAREGPAGGPGQTHLAVEVAAPTGGLLFSYEGSIRWEGHS